MTSESHHFEVVCLLALLVATFGCQSDQQLYDLSGQPPFAGNVGREVTLAREVILVEAPRWAKRDGSDVWATPNALARAISASPDRTLCPDAMMLYPDDDEKSFEYLRTHEALYETKLRTRRLPAGTHVRVDFTYLLEKPTGRGLHMYEMQSVVRISGLGGEWPPEAYALFDHGLSGGSFLVLASFDGRVRPAPWEPRTTPAVRELSSPWPDRSLLVRPAPRP